jgi:hypothetical protein
MRVTPHTPRDPAPHAAVPAVRVPEPRFHVCHLVEQRVHQVCFVARAEEVLIEREPSTMRCPVCIV